MKRLTPQAIEYNERLRMDRKKKRLLSIYTKLSVIPEDYLEDVTGHELRHDSGKILDSQGHVIALV